MTNPIVFNITVKLGKDDSGAFVTALKKQILPVCTDGDIILSSQINKIHLAEEDGDETFAIQFIYASHDIFISKKLTTMAQFIGLLDEQFRGRYVYFATMMELLHLQK